VRIILATGGFDPIHSGHIEYFKSSAELGDMFIVGLNSDSWLQRKKGRAFLPIHERIAIIENLKMVDMVVEFNDDGNNSVECIKNILEKFPDDEILFVNGGDRNYTNVPEQFVFENHPRIKFQFGVGGNDKRNSSRWILEEWRAPKTLRPWGNYRVIHETGKTFKVKELNLDPNKTLSMQQHEFRSEFWFVAEGYATVYIIDEFGSQKLKGVFGPHEDIWIPKNSWHRLANESNEPLRLIEFQYGSECSEWDITRK